MKVTFVSQGGPHLASHRYRVQKPIELINKYTNNIAATSSHKGDPESDVLVFSKHFDRSGNYMSVCSAPDFGYRTVFDICDDYFDKAEGAYYRDMCERVDAITCNSENMQTRIYDCTGKLATVIPDPVTFPRIKPEDKDYSEPKVLWFGHQSNAQPLLAWANECPYRITAVCDAKLNHPNIDWVQWGVGVVESMIANYNIVLIPTKKDERTKCKSPNRALDALNSGCGVITNDKELYKDLPVLEYNDETFKTLKNQWNFILPGVYGCIAKGMSIINKNYSDQIILDKWLDVFKQIGTIKTYA